MGAIDGSRYITNAGWADVPHLSEDEKAALRTITPAHLLPAAEHGLPVSSVGRIYPWDFARIEVDPFRLPDSWPRVYAFDPSVNNTAATWAALDEQTDTLYLYGEYFGTHQITRMHAETIKARGDWITGVCDPAAEAKIIDGRKVIEIYRGHGLALELAQNAVTAGLNAVTDRIVTGRIRAFSTLAGLRFEWNNYQRDKNQKIVKKNDHRIDCVRYTCLGGLRHARINPKFMARMVGGEPRSTIGDTHAGF